MADTKVIQAVISTNTLKRIEAQPEKKSALKASNSKIAAILINEALNAREAVKKEKTK